MKKLASLFTILLFVGACSSDNGAHAKKEDEKETVKNVVPVEVKNGGIKKSEEQSLINQKESVQSTLPEEAKNAEAKKSEEPSVVTPNETVNNVPPEVKNGGEKQLQNPNYENQKEPLPGSSVPSGDNNAVKQPQS